MKYFNGIQLKKLMKYINEYKTIHNTKEDILNNVGNRAVLGHH